MSNHSSQKTINTHHQQVANAKLRKLKREYEREHKRELHRQEMKALVIAWEVLKGIIIACGMTMMMSAVVYALHVVYGG